MPATSRRTPLKRYFFCMEVNLEVQVYQNNNCGGKYETD